MDGALMSRFNYLESPFAWESRNLKDPFGGSKWVDPNHTLEKSRHPYNYSEFFIFGGHKATREKGVEANYSDRLWQWDREKADKAWKAHVNTGWAEASQAQLSAFISEYFNKQLRAVALAEGCNPSSGYPYWILWHVETK